MYRPALSVAPTSTPVTYEEVVAHLRVDADDEEELIRLYIDAATAYLDGYYGVLGRALVTQTWIQKYDGWNAKMYLPVFPVASITTVSYLNSAGTPTTVTATDYALYTDDCGDYVEFDQAFSYPTTSVESGPKITITYVSGAAVSAVPVAIKQAMLLLIGHWFQNRETISSNTGGGISTELAYTVKHLIAPYRRMTF
jgi:uncharacterized phiE125 gp8 family phage protein